MNFNPDGSIRSVFSGDILWQSEIRKIGKHDWKITVYQRDDGAFVGYEWRRAAEWIRGVVNEAGEPYVSEADPWWKTEEDWPKYDHNRSDDGLPVTLAKWYEEDRDVIKSTLAKVREPAAQAVPQPTAAAPEPGM